MDDLPRWAEVKQCRPTPNELMQGQPSSRLGSIVVALTKAAMFGAVVAMCVDRRDLSAHCTGCLVCPPKGPSRHPPSDLSMESSISICLCSDSLFNLADSLLNFSGILFSSDISFQVGVLGKLAGLLLDCAFDFVKLACCLIVRARFHHDSLLC